MSMCSFHEETTPSMSLVKYPDGTCGVIGVLAVARMAIQLSTYRTRKGWILWMLLRS